MTIRRERRPRIILKIFATDKSGKLEALFIFSAGHQFLPIAYLPRLFQTASLNND
jgi:hypothetical protein